MTRLYADEINKYKEMSYESLRNPLLVCVDMVNGFIKEGAMHDKAILEITPAIIELIKHMDKTVFIADTHEENAQEFSSYPKHCVKGTSESEIIDELKAYATYKIEKNSTNTFHSKGWQNFMNDEIEKYQDIVICGCCTDICVMQFALTLQTYFHEFNMDKKVIIPINAVETYHIENIHNAYVNNANALSNMAGNAIHVVTKLSD